MNRLVDRLGLLGAFVGILRVVDNRQWRTCAYVTTIVLYWSANTDIGIERLSPYQLSSSFAG